MSTSPCLHHLSSKTHVVIHTTTTIGAPDKPLVLGAIIAPPHLARPDAVFLELGLI
jgi:hypothetical protein